MLIAAEATYAPEPSVQQQQQQLSTLTMQQNHSNSVSPDVETTISHVAHASPTPESNGRGRSARRRSSSAVVMMVYARGEFDSTIAALCREATTSTQAKITSVHNSVINISTLDSTPLFCLPLSASTSEHE